MRTHVTLCTTIDDLALKRLEHNSAISRDELCLAVPR